MNDELKQAVGGYFEELRARIRDIRYSEKVLWRKALPRAICPNTTTLIFNTVFLGQDWLTANI